VQIIIPMSGFGERFRKAGYNTPKPLIEVDGKPIIQYIVEMFSKEDDFIFVCNKDHLLKPEYKMQQILESITTDSQIIAIEPHKLGPVYAVLQVIEKIDLNKETIVNYADFTCDWDYGDFCKTILESGCDGAIPCYRDFHPHTIWSNYYAYVREDNLKINDIQEKKPFTHSPRDEFASSGTYYFKTGDLMRYYFERCITDNLMVSGEYYASMAFKPMIQDGLNIQVYKLNHFMQWGVPSDLEEYVYWSNIFRSILHENSPPQHKGYLMLPMVGMGSRFLREGYKLAKPLLPVSGKPMAVQALMDLPQTEYQNFILRKDINGIDKLKNSLQSNFPCSKFTILDHMTDGQASSCVEGSSEIDINEPVTIAACDNGMLYSSSNFELLMRNDDVDVIVWTAKGYPGAIRSPEMYGWVDINKFGVINKISVKKPLSNPLNDSIVVGTFTFKKLDYFLKSVERMKDREALVNGEYYVDTAINDAVALGLRCVVFEIDYYICWGTPNDLRTFEYWQSCFDGWDSHPYKKELDINYGIN
jgi:NDP-sugar pyrophosphorylase family protein